MISKLKEEMVKVKRNNVTSANTDAPLATRMSVGSLAIFVRSPPGQEAVNLDTTSSKVAHLDPDPEATSVAGGGMGVAASSTKILAGSWEDFVIGGRVGGVFVAGAALFCADLPEPRALAALANIAEILEHEGGVEGREVLALDLAEAGAGGGLGSVPTRRDPDTILAAGVGEGTGEGRAGIVLSPAPEDEGDPVTTGVADTARREEFSENQKKEYIYAYM